jgi:hypothetical protein
MNLDLPIACVGLIFYVLPLGELVHYLNSIFVSRAFSKAVTPSSLSLGFLIELKY